AGVKRLERGLKESDSGVKTVIAVELPKQRSFMHLDTVFTFINRHECLIYPPVILPGGDEAATVTTIDLTQRSLQYTEEKSLLHALKRQKFDLKPIYCGGAKAVDQQREQWTDGAKAFDETDDERRKTSPRGRRIRRKRAAASRRSRHAGRADRARETGGALARGDRASRLQIDRRARQRAAGRQHPHPERRGVDE